MHSSIIVISTYLSNGGAERVLSELMNEWVRNGHKVQLILTRKDIYGQNYTLDDRVEIHRAVSRYSNKALRRIEDTCAVIRLLRKNPDAAVISFDLSTQALMAAAKLFCKNKMIFSERNDPRRYPEKRWQRIARDLIFYTADFCVFQTMEAKKCFSRAIRKKGVVIANPVGRDFPARILEGRRKVITAVCQLEERKNLPMLIHAFKNLSEKYPEYSVEIYGKGKEEENLKKLIHGLGMEARIRLMGFAQDVKERIVDSTLYVSTSDYEGISNSMLEALAMGIPSICTDCPIYGARAMIQNGINGLLIPVGDGRSLERAIDFMLSNPEKAEKMSENAYKIREKYSVRKVAEKWLRAIHRGK